MVTMYKIKFVDSEGKKQKLIIPEARMWLSFGNFAGMGKFSKLTIKKVKKDLDK